MKKILLVLMGVIILNPAQLFAGDEEDIKKQILANNAYAKKNNQAADEYSAKGALEFWSSGRLLHTVSPGGRPEKYDYMNIDFKHIEVVVLVPKKAAVAMYYSEGSMKPENAPAVSHYLTRVTQVFVKEGGKWKIRASLERSTEIDGSKRATLAKLPPSISSGKAIFTALLPISANSTIVGRIS